MVENFSKELNQMSFEDAMKELDTIVRRMDAGDVSLDESLNLYNRGKALENFCRDKLENAKLQVDKIVDQNDTISKIPAQEFEI